MVMCNFEPRNDWVLIRVVKIGQTDTGIALPDLAIEGKEFVVVAAGPEVQDLMPGDKVLMIGQRNVVYFEVPGTNDLLVIKQEHVVLVGNKYLEPEPGETT